MPAPHLSSDFLSSWPALLRERGHRHLLVLTGRAGWGVATAQALSITTVSSTSGVWVGSGGGSLPTRTPAQAVGCVGQELSWVVWNAHDGLHAEGLCVLAGTLVAGGVLVILWPDNEASGFAAWLAASFAAVGVSVWREGEPVPTLPLVAACQAPFHFPDGPSAEQQAVIAAIRRVATGHRRRPLVLTADRGRGKSAALGMAAASLMAERPCRVLVTAPSKRAAATVFEHACAAGASPCAGSAMSFVAPDALLRGLPDAELLLVDEAAALPVAVLRQLLARYARVVFATTVHGYEGTGRGFTLKFRADLDRQTPQWRAASLASPIRWAADDPLEAWLNQAFLLSATFASVPAASGEITIDWITAAELTATPSLLHDVIALLVLAHYQTTPGDVQAVLDGTEQHLAVARREGVLVGVVLMQEEGGFDAATAQAIQRGERRPQGHLLAQSLAFHGGMAAAAELRWGRIQRLAVHPTWWRQGVGAALVQAARCRAYALSWDGLGASFGLSAGLLAFWQAQGMALVRLGIHRDASTGEHAAMVIHPFFGAAQALAERLQKRLSRHFLAVLAGPLNALEVHRVIAVCRALASVWPTTAWDDDDQAELQAFAFGHRAYELSEALLPERMVWVLAQSVGAPSSTDIAVVCRVLQRQPWAAVAMAVGVAGRKSVENLLRQRAATLI